MQRLFAQRRVYQKRVMHTLKDALEPSDVLLDMMSGDAVATLSLLNARQISRLLLLDGSLSPTFFSASQVLISKYKLENLATTINVGLGAQTNPNTLPVTAKVALVETGLGLPEEARMERVVHPPILNQNPASFRSAHVYSPTVELPDVLRILGDSPRTLHLMDAPFHQANMTRNTLRDYVEAATNQEGWTITKWTDLESSPLFHAVLTFP